MIFFKKKRQADIQNRMIVGMIMLEDEHSFDADAFRKDLTDSYGVKINAITGDNTALGFEVDNELVGIAHMATPIPEFEIEAAAEHAYNWRTALADLKDHKSNLLVTITTGSQNQIKRFRIFTQIICSLLRTTNAVGIYQSNQNLLIPKKSYLDEASLMTDEHLPVYLWVYFGYSLSDLGNSCYTYGLKEFGKTEMEIIGSNKSVDEISEFMYDLTHYVLAYDVTFKNGQTCGVEADERIEITLSEGEFVKGGETLKLAY